MLYISEVKDALEVGLTALKYLKTREIDRNTRAVIDSLRQIYFERSTLELIKGIPTASDAARRDLVRRLEQKLLGGRYEVDWSLKTLADEGLNMDLSLRQRRLIDFICTGKAQIRSKIFHTIRDAVESNKLDTVSRLLEDIEKLNSAIEEVEEKLGERKGKT